MAIKLDLYRIFCAVAEQQSFSGAAKVLYMTQPAVSQAIMQLENALDTRLFTRTPKGVNLTNDGQHLLEYISSAINLINVGEKKLLERKDLMVGELKMGVGDTISRHFLLPYLERFHNEFPNIKLKIMNRTTPELCAALKSGEIDIAMCNLPIKDSSLEVKECMTVQDIFVCGSKYIDQLTLPLTLEELISHPLIILERKSNSRHYVEKYLLSKGIRILPEIELGSHELLLEFAKINLGIACVIKEFAQEYLLHGDLHQVHIRDEMPTRSIGYCFLKSVSLSPSSSKFVEILEKYN